MGGHPRDDRHGHRPYRVGSGVQHRPGAGGTRRRAFDHLATSAAQPDATVTLIGTGLRAAGWVSFVDGAISWGALSDAARLVIDSWSNTQITFTVPEPSGADYQWQVTPGTTATVSVTRRVVRPVQHGHPAG